MATISKRFLERAKPALRRFSKVLADARSRDVNESDTVVIITDFLEHVLGFDKYSDVTTELAIRGTYCDLAIKVDGRVRFLIEAKAIGKDLRDNHLRQAVDYAAKEGVDWVLLTNGATWQVHRVRFEKPIRHDLVLEVDLLAEERGAELLERLYLLSREACGNEAIDEYDRHREATSRYMVAQVLLADSVLAMVRRELRKVSPGLRITEDEIAELLRNDLLKRDALEGEKAVAAAALLKKVARRRARAAAAESPVAAPLAAGNPPSLPA